MGRRIAGIGIAAGAFFAARVLAGEVDAGMSMEQAQEHLARVFSNVEVSEVRRAPIPGVYEIISEDEIYYLSGDGGFMLAGVPYDLKRDARLSERIRNDPDALRPTPMSGVYEMVFDSRVYYLNKDGSFTLVGVLYDLESDINLTEQLRNEMRRDAIVNIKESETIVYSPPEYRYTVNVFSDPNCPYCQKLHSQIDAYNKLGIRVRYLLTPLLGSQARAQAIGVWCSKDRRAALDRAKRNEPVEGDGCEHPIDENLALSKLVGVYATPAVLLENGKLINGYRPPVELLQIIKEEGIRPRG